MQIILFPTSAIVLHLEHIVPTLAAAPRFSMHSTEVHFWNE